MHEFKHPKYYKELRKLRNKLDQVISSEDHDAYENERAPGSGLKPQASSGKRQASAGGKPQAASLEKQASSPEEQASSRKP